MDMIFVVLIVSVINAALAIINAVVMAKLHDAIELLRREQKKAVRIVPE